MNEGAGSYTSVTGLALREDPPLLPLATTRLNILTFRQRSNPQGQASVLDRRKRPVTF